MFQIKFTTFSTRVPARFCEDPMTGKPKTFPTSEAAKSYAELSCFRNAIVEKAPA